MQRYLIVHCPPLFATTTLERIRFRLLRSSTLRFEQIELDQLPIGSLLLLGRHLLKKSRATHERQYQHSSNGAKKN